MRHLVKTNFEPLFKNLFDMENTNCNTNANTPAVNIAENETAYHLEFSLAGYKKEDLKINIENDTLTVSANLDSDREKKENTTEGEDKKYTRREYSTKSFSRSFYLPEQVKEKNIDATLENGILSLTLPKAEKVKAKEISIK